MPFMVAVNVTGLVTPRMVRSPAKSAVVSPVLVMPVETKVIWACSPTFRKSVLRTCSSRASKKVSTEAASIVKDTLEFSMFSGSKSIAASKSRKVP